MRRTIADKSGMLIFAALALAFALGSFAFLSFAPDKQPIKIGILHSLTGTMATSEAPLVDAIRLAVEEANADGGVRGRRIEVVVADCSSDAEHCAGQAERLITGDNVAALFGCWTSSCRKAVKQVVERHHHLLFYPVQYEGLEQSPDIFYTGAAPNQQIIPMAQWAHQNIGNRFYLAGSDYVFPRTANRIVKDVLLAQGARLAGERYVPLGSSEVAGMVEEIIRVKPDFVLNTLNGESNRHFFQALHNAGVSSANIPVFSTSIAEVELAAMGPALMTGHYAGWNYFQSIDSAENSAFVARFKQRFGQDRVLSDPMEAAYLGVNLWVNAARSVGVGDTAQLKLVLSQQSIPAPEGVISVDFDTQHLWKTARIGKARSDGQFDIVWQSPAPLHPAPFPFYRTRNEWHQFAAEGGR
ncbi:MAG: ABC transporter substrate-binding protein [Gallionella sp.]|nr:ABC transporter substrate-binding protein [Gallionella sp.]